MSEESLKILKLLEEKKISIDEANALLEALDKSTTALIELADRANEEAGASPEGGYGEGVVQGGGEGLGADHGGWWCA